MNKKVWNGKIEKDEFIQLQESSAKIMGLNRVKKEASKVNGLHKFGLMPYMHLDEDYYEYGRFKVIPVDANGLTYNKSEKMNADGVWDIESVKDIENFPSSNVVQKHLMLDGLGLKTLKGCPRKVKHMFDCSSNRLTSFIGAPEWIGANFICTDNPISNLDGFPKYIGGIAHLPDSMLKFTTEEEIRAICDIKYRVEFHKPNIPYKSWKKNNDGKEGGYSVKEIDGSVYRVNNMIVGSVIVDYKNIRGFFPAVMNIVKSQNIPIDQDRIAQVRDVFKMRGLENYEKFEMCAEMFEGTGWFMYEDPELEGSDSYGRMIINKSGLTESELSAISLAITES